MGIGRFLLIFGLASTFLLSGGIFSCQNLNEEELFGLSCDTSEVSYSEDIAPIIQGNCLHCHYKDSPIVDFSLEGHANVLVRVNTGQLKQAVNHEPGAREMPDDGPKLPECELSLINIWIRNGAPNN